MERTTDHNTATAALIDDVAVTSVPLEAALIHLARCPECRPFLRITHQGHVLADSGAISVAKLHVAEIIVNGPAQAVRE
jgi:hypothetical protein